jgi:tetratricopeptide (TPR) repeat protein
LGAEYAQIGMYERSAEHLKKAIAIDPAMHIARFQLGLLYLTSGQIAEASTTWAPLNTLGVAHYLFLFKSGLEHLASDQFDACRDCLNRGIASNADNPALSDDMRRILDDLPERATADAADGEPNAFFLSAYTGNTH